MYSELQNGYEYEATETTITGRRTFVRDDANGIIGDNDLPIPGESAMVDPDGDEVSVCICRRIRQRFDDAGHVMLIAEYSATIARAGAAIHHDPDRESFNLGVGNHVIDGRSWYWTASPYNPITNQMISRRVPIGSFTRSIVVPSSSKATWLTIADGMAFKINDASFGDKNIGEVMFMGYTGGTTTNIDGDIEYRFDLHFEFVLLRQWGITTYSHQYVWNSDTGDYDRPNTNNLGTGDYLYDTGDFTTLFSV